MVDWDYGSQDLNFVLSFDREQYVMTSSYMFAQSMPYAKQAMYLIINKGHLAWSSNASQVTYSQRPAL